MNTHTHLLEAFSKDKGGKHPQKSSVLVKHHQTPGHHQNRYKNQTQTQKLSIHQQPIATTIKTTIKNH